MSEARALFRSHLTAAVREAQTSPPPVPVAPVRTVEARPVKKRVAIRLWLPLTPLWLLLAPFALLLAPALRLAPDGRQVRPYRAAWALGGTLMALSGTVVHVEAPRALIHVRIL